MNSTEKKNKAGLHDRLSLFLDLKRSNGDCKMHAGTFGIYRRIAFAVLQLGGTVSWYQNFAQAIPHQELISAILVVEPLLMDWTTSSRKRTNFAAFCSIANDMVVI